MLLWSILFKDGDGTDPGNVHGEKPIKGIDDKLASTPEEITEAWAVLQVQLETPSPVQGQDEVSRRNVESQVVLPVCSPVCFLSWRKAQRFIYRVSSG
jgi:hypothetical protein